MEDFYRFQPLHADMSIELISWNVNGIRAVAKKGFYQWFHSRSPDILCLQETKAWPEQLETGLTNPPGYHAYWDWAERKGYSGTVAYTKEKPLENTRGLDIPEFDTEGRTVCLEYPDFTLFNIYFPNGKGGPERLSYKMRFYDAFLQKAKNIVEQGKNVVVCGDFNTAHKEIDLARAKENENVSGFLPVERQWMDKLVESGFVDTFRHFNKEPDNYSWWDMKSRARDRNVGWRIDYFFINEGLIPHLKDACILTDVMGSDHCPVGIVLDF